MSEQKRRDLANITQPHIDRVYVAVGNTDMTEGRGSPTVIAVCLTHAGALAAGKGNGVYGSDAPVEERTAVFIPGGTLYLLERAYTLTPDDPNEVLRQAGLKKLTPAERRTLGL